MDYSYDPGANTVYASARGELHLDGLVDYLQAVVSDSRIRPGFVEVVDLSEVTDLAFGYKDRAPFPDLWRRYGEKGCRGTIVYAPTDVAYGTIRMVLSHIESDTPAPVESFHVVRTRAEVEELLTLYRELPRPE